MTEENNDNNEPVQKSEIALNEERVFGILELKF